MTIGNTTISKGAYFCTIYPTEVPEEYSNKLTILPIPQTATNQDTGAKDTKILDLLRLTHTFVIKAYLTGSSTASSSDDDHGGSSTLTAKQVKGILKNIINGANIKGGTCTLTYDSNTYNGYIERCMFIEKSADDPSARNNVDEARYEINLTFVEGVAIGVSS